MCDLPAFGIFHDLARVCFHGCFRGEKQTSGKWVRNDENDR